MNLNHGSLKKLGQQVVLIVEDEVELLETLSALLEMGGYQILRAQDGIEALAILDEHTQALGSPNVDVIVSDLLMPGLDGFELLTEIRSGPYKTIPFLILSGTLDMTKVNQLISLGVDGILYKPFDKDNLLSEVAKSIIRRRKKNETP